VSGRLKLKIDEFSAQQKKKRTIGLPGGMPNYHRQKPPEKIHGTQNFTSMRSEDKHAKICHDAHLLRISNLRLTSLKEMMRILAAQLIH
jgi:hypothetical protein